MEKHKLFTVEIWAKGNKADKPNTSVLVLANTGQEAKRKFKDYWPATAETFQRMRVYDTGEEVWV